MINKCEFCGKASFYLYQLDLEHSTEPVGYKICNNCHFELKNFILNKIKRSEVYR